MKPIARRVAVAVAAAALLTTVVQFPLTTRTDPAEALTAAGSVIELQVTGVAGVPADASAVVLNLTATDNTVPGGYVTAYPCGTTRPNASNLNYGTGDVVANSATVPVGAGGKVCLYTFTPTNLIVDINGYYPATSQFRTTAPTRLLDTRPTRTGADTVTELQVTGLAGVPADASAVVLNLTATDNTVPGGYVTAYPCGTTRPNASNLNYGTGDVVANSATVPVGAGGKVCLYTFTPTNLIVDINGYYPATSQFRTTAPTRLLDTRPTRTGADTVTELQVTGLAGVPADASAVVLNLTATDNTVPGGYVTAYPCGTTRPNASNLNYGTGDVVANSATVPVGAGGKVCLYTFTPTNLIVDINGYYPATSDFRTTAPTRLLDTRTTPTATGPASAAPAATATGQFVESFSGNTGLERFDFGVYHRDDGMVAQTQWQADHDMMCGDPTATSRTVHRNTSEWIFQCRDHLMSSIGDTSGYSTGWFEPKQTFSNATQISWDANITDLLGRKWWEVTIVPASYNSGVPSCPHCAVSQAFSPSPAGLPAYPAGSVSVNLRYTVFANGAETDAAMHIPKGTFDPEGFASKAIRRPFSITDNRNGTITVNWGGVRTATVPGSFPAGEFRVVFKDHNYTPTKDGTPVGMTWHWDNIVIR